MFQKFEFQHGQERRTWSYSGISKRTLVRAASMDPIADVEVQLGSVDSWPLYILRLMFMLESNSRVMKNVAAFKYENNVRLRDAVA